MMQRMANSRMASATYADNKDCDHAFTVEIDERGCVEIFPAEDSDTVAISATDFAENVAAFNEMRGEKNDAGQ